MGYLPRLQRGRVFPGRDRETVKEKGMSEDAIKKLVKVDDIIQITDAEHGWYPCLLIVSEVHPWGVQAYIHIPQTNDGSQPAETAYNRLANKQFEVVGNATIVEF
jgi:hypothetical protein